MPKRWTVAQGTLVFFCGEKKKSGPYFPTAEQSHEQFVASYCPFVISLLFFSISPLTSPLISPIHSQP